jgi:predicted Zn-dependent peptidase
LCSFRIGTVSQRMRSRKGAHHTAIPDETHFRKSVLNNGVRVISEYIPTVRSVSVGLWIDVGSRDEHTGKSGISHFVEHMVFKGTHRRNMRQIAQSLESIGGYINAFTTKEHTCFYARVLDEHLEKAVDVITDLIKEPTFHHKEIEKEKYVVLEELKQIEDDPDDLIHDYLDKVLYHPHPLGEPVIGNMESIRGLKRNDLFEHLERNYTPNRIVLAAAGNVDHDELVRYVDQYLGSLKRRSVRNGLLRLPRKRNKFIEIEKPIHQANICMGTKTFGVHSTNRYPLLVLNALIGEGMSSRLNQIIREKHGLAYMAYSFVNLLRDTGMFGVYIGTDAEKVDKAVQLVHREFGKLQDKPVSQAELNRTKSQIKGNLMLGLENMSGRMMRIGAGELYFRKYTSLDAIIKKVNEISSGDIQNVARDVLDARKFSTVVFKPTT